MPVEQTPGGAIIVSGNSIHLYGLLSLRTAMRLYQRCGLRTRAHGNLTSMLRTAGEQTGQTYKRNQLALAIENLTTVIDAQEPGQ